MMRIALTFVSTLFLSFVSLFFPFQSYAKVVINEFHSSTSDNDWVELYNDGENTEELSLYRLRDSSANNKIDLTGSLNSHAYVSFSWSNRLGNSGDIIKLVTIADESIVDQVGYGDEGGDIIAPLGAYSAGRLPNGTGTWNIFETSTQGFANTGIVITPTNTPTPSPTLTPTPTKTPTPTNTPKPTTTPTLTPTPKSTATNTPVPTRREATYPTTKANTGKLSTTTISPFPTAVLGSSTEDTTPEPTKVPSPTQEIKTLGATNTPLQTAFLIGMGILAITTVGLGGYIYKQSKDHL